MLETLSLVQLKVMRTNEAFNSAVCCGTPLTIFRGGRSHGDITTLVLTRYLERPVRFLKRGDSTFGGVVGGAGGRCSHAHNPLAIFIPM